MEKLFSVSNQHSEDCGKPPVIDGDDGKYHGYFESAAGDQWLFTFDRKTQEVELRGGDLGWEETRDRTGLKDIILGEEEGAWLVSCLLACGLITDEDDESVSKEQTKEDNVIIGWVKEHGHELDADLMRRIHSLPDVGYRDLTPAFRLAVMAWSQESAESLISTYPKDLRNTPEKESRANIEGAWAEGFLLGVIFGRKYDDQVFRNLPSGRIRKSRKK